MFPTPNVSRRDKAHRSCRTRDHRASAETLPGQDLDSFRHQVPTTNEILLPTEPSYDPANRHQAARKTQPFRAASVHLLLVWPSPHAHVRNPWFPNNRRAARRAGETVSSCSNRLRAVRLQLGPNNTMALFVLLETI